MKERLPMGSGFFAVVLLLLAVVAVAAVLSLQAPNQPANSPAAGPEAGSVGRQPGIPGAGRDSGVVAPSPEGSGKKNATKLFSEAVGKVYPEKGFQSRIALKDSVLVLLRYGVIDEQKFRKLYEARGGLPNELSNAFSRASNEPMLLTRNNSNAYLNVLWGVGLSNYLKANEESPVNGSDLYDFASTGGWILGREKRGGSYFNKYGVAPLTPEQEALVMLIANSTFRPCCNNPTFFQDCNHGSALLGLLELGASQGLTESELYEEALAFNSFWFPSNYAQTAVYFEQVKGIEWKTADAKLVLSKNYSSISGWNENVHKPLAALGLVPQAGGGASCAA